MKIIITCLVLITILSCSKNDTTLNEDIPDNSDYHGRYNFSINIIYNIANPNISSYEAPSSFQTTVTRSVDYDDEINFSNIHGLGRCVYAVVNGNNFTIPRQELEGTSDGNIGFNITGNCGSCTLWVSGSGTLTEEPRTNSADEKFTMTLEYQISFDTTPLVTVRNTSTFKNVVSNLPAPYSCQ